LLLPFLVSLDHFYPCSVAVHAVLLRFLQLREREASTEPMDYDYETMRKRTSAATRVMIPLEPMNKLPFCWNQQPAKVHSTVHNSIWFQRSK
jgi:hypothetical protein